MFVRGYFVSFFISRVFDVPFRSIGDLKAH